MPHSITIVIYDDGRVEGDVDDEVAIYPIGTDSTTESTTIDGQARSILDQALSVLIGKDFARSVKSR